MGFFCTDFVALVYLLKIVRLFFAIPTHLHTGSTDPTSRSCFQQAECYFSILSPPSRMSCYFLHYSLINACTFG